MDRPSIFGLSIDLAAERQTLDNLLSKLPEEAWDRPSPVPGWTIRDCMVHLAEMDERATTTVLTPDEPPLPSRTASQQTGALTITMRAWRKRPVAAVLEWWREVSHRLLGVLLNANGEDSVSWQGRRIRVDTLATARIMEYWSHGLDIHDAAGATPIDTDRLRHVADLAYNARPAAYQSYGLEPPATPIFIQLVAPSGKVWTWGPPDAEDRIYGSAGDWCRVVTQRIHPADTGLRTEGARAREFLDIAQALAGTSGPQPLPRASRN